MINLLLTTVICLVSVKADQKILTLPISHVRLDHQQSEAYIKTHHLRHLTYQHKAVNQIQTYPLHSLKTIFTLHLKVNGFDYNLSVDTGSSDLFIKGQDMQGKPQRKFSCKKCIKQNKYLSIGYLDGQLDTYVHNSSIVLGNHTFKQSILVAYASNNINNFRKLGGIVGLSFQQIARNPYPNFINTLIKQKIINKYRFGLKMNFKDPDSSYITFGGYDSQYIDSAHSITYHKLHKEFSYSLETQYLKFGDKQLNLTVALIDSGNTCVSIDEKYTNDMLQEFNKGGNQCEFQVQHGNTLFKILACRVKDFDILPVINVVMPDGKNYSWQKQYYLDRCYEIQNQNKTSYYKCQTFIENVKNNLGDGLFLGAAWLLKYYAVFDIDQKQIGFAKNRDNPTLQNIKNKAQKRENQPKIKKIPNPSSTIKQ